MKAYKRKKGITTFWLWMGIFWFLLGGIDWLYRGVYTLLPLAVLFFIGHYLASRPYVLIGEDRIIVYHNFLKATEYSLSDIWITEQNKAFLKFGYLKNGREKEFKLHLSILDPNDAGKINKVIKKGLKKNKKEK